jgi:hypothetical protein
MEITYGQAKEAIDSLIATYVNEKIIDEKEMKKIFYSISKDVQLRDYLMGKPFDTELTELLSLMPLLISFSEREGRAPLYAIYSSWLYENGDTESALLNLSACREVNKDYSLAGLLDRVMKSNWPNGSFKGLRAELHPKVSKGIDKDKDKLITYEEEKVTSN